MGTRSCMRFVVLFICCYHFSVCLNGRLFLEVPTASRRLVMTLFLNDKLNRNLNGAVSGECNSLPPVDKLANETGRQHREDLVRLHYLNEIFMMSKHACFRAYSEWCYTVQRHL